MSYSETILRQYSGLEKINSMIDTFNQAVSMDDFTDTFIEDVWDVLSCGSYGLDVWGKIVSIGRYVESDSTSETFGFDGGESTYSFSPFNTYPFYSEKKETNSVRLADDAYRTLILAKAFSNISIATIPDINKFLSILFKGRGKAFCANYRDMTIGITVNFKLYQFEKTLLTNYDVMPVPSGVRILINQVSTKYFGFSKGYYPFNSGVFAR